MRGRGRETPPPAFGIGELIEEDNVSVSAERRPGILVDVHPGLLLCGDGRLATTNVAEMARVDNLVRLHN